MDPTAALWQRRSPHSPAIPTVAALTGIDVGTLSDATAIALAASDEAGALLDGMEVRIRTLPSAVATSAERCAGSVRGPIMWSETLTARANSFGNEDVFVCMTTARSFDRVENQLLVDALDSIAAAARALRGPTGERVTSDDAEKIGAVADEARRWRSDDRLAGIRPRRLTGRAAAHVRGGHRKAWIEPVLAVRRRAREPFHPEDVSGLTDEWTRTAHGHMLRVLDALDLRRPLSLSDGGVWCGPVSFRHPDSPGSGVDGLAVRGRPVLPVGDELAGAPWAHRLAGEGIRLPQNDDPQALRELLVGHGGP